MFLVLSSCKKHSYSGMTLTIMSQTCAKCLCMFYIMRKVVKEILSTMHTCLLDKEECAGLQILHHELLVFPL